MKKLIAFDLDGTLAESKSEMTDQMADVFTQALEKFEICVISGGRFEQFEKQLLSNLKAHPAALQRLHLMPTCGTRYYAYDPPSCAWKQVYAEDIKESDKKRIIDALNKGFDDLGYREKKTYGDSIEDRGSQITFSVLGQDIVDELGKEGLRLKHAWDPDNKKKLELRDYIAPLIPDYEVRVGGVTSIDVTRLGIDKAYGMKKLCEILDINQDDILFMGDRLQEGGNDYPVKAMGIDCLEISHWQDTARSLQAILHVL